MLVYHLQLEITEISKNWTKMVLCLIIAVESEFSGTYVINIEYLMPQFLSLLENVRHEFLFLVRIRFYLLIAVWIAKCFGNP